jgi:hypothetical protein
MSKYTITIKALIDNHFDFELDEYPIFDENYRDVLNKNILDYYYISEIGFETPALFRHFLKNSMNLIMPKYNIMYQAQIKLAENALGNVDLTETLERSVENEASSESESNGTNKNLFQDTPQGQLASTDIENQKWATNLTLNSNKITDETSSDGSTTEEYTKQIIGSNGKKYNIEIYEKLNRNLKSIDMMIIEELNDLFMGLF